jgi:hypothetical protein
MIDDADSAVRITTAIDQLRRFSRMIKKSPLSSDIQRDVVLRVLQDLTQHDLRAAVWFLVNELDNDEQGNRLE